MVARGQKLRIQSKIHPGRGFTCSRGKRRQGKDSTRTDRTRLRGYLVKPYNARMSETSTEKQSLIRMVDANANRASEAFRVVEDVLRFARNDRTLTDQFKQLRHSLQVLVAQMAQLPSRCAHRDATGDVGTTIQAPTEYLRASAEDLLATNSQRGLQALRVLEEAAKILNPAVAATIEQLRYRAYDLEKQLLTPSRMRRYELLKDARLCVLLRGLESQGAFEAYADRLFRAGADMIQLRDKNLNDRELLKRARALTKVADDHGKLAMINDRADIAYLAEAHGAHVGQEELPAQEARTLLGDQRLLGVSTHSLEQARQASSEGADYIGVGPTFSSSTKKFENLQGIELIAQIAVDISIPTYAIGGISPDNLDGVLAAGGRRIAVSGAIHDARDPAEVIQRLQDQLRQFPLHHPIEFA
jgi:thiamine-phosphate pyrophosphorylase